MRAALAVAPTVAVPRGVSTDIEALFAEDVTSRLRQDLERVQGIAGRIIL